MKKILIGAAAALALSMSFGTAYAIPGASQYCTDNGDFGLSHGRCTELVTKIFDKSTSNDAVEACKEFEAFYPDDFTAFGFKNRGDCISWLRSLGF
jgi:hypothetical protein